MGRVMPTNPRPWSDRLFMPAIYGLAAIYVGLLVVMLAADVSFTSWADLREAWATPEIRYAATLSLMTATVSAVLSVWVATPIGYLMARAPGVDSPRWRRVAYAVLDAVLDVPIVLPPLVVGVSLLIVFRLPPFAWISDRVVYEVPAVILAQFTVACAFAVRTMRAAFEQVPRRQEQVALTLGASRAWAFLTVLLPQVRAGMLTAATLAWARSLGEFGPVLIFASSTRMRTEVLPTTVFLEIQSGNLRSALAVSLLMIGLALLVLVAVRLAGRVGAAPVDR